MAFIAAIWSGGKLCKIINVQHLFFGSIKSHNCSKLVLNLCAASPIIGEIAVGMMLGPNGFDKAPLTDNIPGGVKLDSYSWHIE